MKLKHKTKHYSLTLLLMCFLAGLGIFFGVDVANRGIERIQGPFQTAGADTQSKQGISNGAVTASGAINQSIPTSANPETGTIRTTTRPPGGAQTVITKAQQEAVHPVLQDSVVNRLSNKIGEVLRGLAGITLRLISTIFQSIFA